MICRVIWPEKLYPDCLVAADVRTSLDPYRKIMTTDTSRLAHAPSKYHSSCNAQLATKTCKNVKSLMMLLENASAETVSTATTDTIQMYRLNDTDPLKKKSCSYL